MDGYNFINYGFDGHWQQQCDQMQQEQDIFDSYFWSDEIRGNWDLFIAKYIEPFICLPMQFIKDLIGNDRNELQSFFFLGDWFSNADFLKEFEIREMAFDPNSLPF